MTQATHSELPAAGLGETFTRPLLLTPAQDWRGYLLGKAPEDINLLQVIEAVEGPIILNLCQSSPPQCHEELCKIRPLWTELQKTVKEKLSGMKLSEALKK